MWLINSYNSCDKAWVILSFLRAVYCLPYVGSLKHHLANSEGRRQQSTWVLRETWAKEEMVLGRTPPIPGLSPASSCLLPALLSRRADPPGTRGPKPAALSDPLCTEGRGCLDPWGEGSRRQGSRARFFWSSQKLEREEPELEREVMRSPRRQLSRQGVWELGIKPVRRTGWVVSDKVQWTLVPHFPPLKHRQCYG